MVQSMVKRQRSNVVVLAFLWLALLTALYGWAAGIGAPYREFPEDQLEIVGLIASIGFGTFAVAILIERGAPPPRALRVAGWIGCTVVLLLPAFVVGNLFMPLPGYDALSCGSLFGIAYDVPTDPISVEECSGIRARRTYLACALGVAGLAASVWLAVRLAGHRRERVERV